MRILFVVLFGLIAPQAFAQNVNRLHCEAFESIMLVSNEAGIINPSRFGAEVDLLAKYSKRDVYRKLGVPVGRLDSQTDVDGPSDCWPCTAFLIAPGRLMTNHHCATGLPAMLRQQGVAGATKVERARLIMGYMNDDAVAMSDGVRVYEVDPDPIEANKDLDYAILKVDPQASTDFGLLELSTETPEPNDSLFIIGHPRGLAKRLSLRQCRVKPKGVVDGRLQHRCSTLPGNSGSPVFDNNARTVIALHSAAAPRIGTDDVTNLAVPIALIAAQSDLVAGLVAGNITPTPDPVVKPASGDELVVLQIPPQEKASDDVDITLSDTTFDLSPLLPSGEVIPTLQSKLAAHNCDPGTVDGSFGPSSARGLLFYNAFKPSGCAALTPLDRVKRSPTARFLKDARANIKILEACAAPACGATTASEYYRSLPKGCIYQVRGNRASGEYATWSGACDSKGFATGRGTLTYTYPVAVKDTFYTSYTGDMCSGQLCGRGVRKQLSGAVYDGEFKNDRPHGVGRYEYADGSFYKGSYLNGSPHGQGERRYASGGRYVGTWNKGARTGFGTYYRANGETSYKGDWLKGKRHGDGTVYFDDNSRWVGAFNNGEKHGTGTYYPNSGNPFTVTYRNDKQV